MGLPKADVLKFVLEDKSWIAIRPLELNQRLSSTLVFVEIMK